MRYSVQAGHITIPKATKPEHILENAQVFDWSIPEEDIALMVRFKTLLLQKIIWFNTFIKIMIDERG